MRQCIPSCSLAVVFFVSMLYFTYWKIENKGEVLDNFEKLLFQNKNNFIIKSKKNEELFICKDICSTFLIYPRNHLQKIQNR